VSRKKNLHSIQFIDIMLSLHQFSDGGVPMYDFWHARNYTLHSALSFIIFFS